MRNAKLKTVHRQSAPVVGDEPSTIPHSEFRIPHSQDPVWVRWSLVLFTVAFLSILVVVPVIAVFAEALRSGLGAYWHNLTAEPDTRHAVFLTLIVAPSSVALNVVFGVAAAWTIARFRFPGKTLLLAIIDLPFAVSPVVVGLMFVLLFGAKGYFGPWLQDHGFQILYTVPALILATTFVTLPFVAKELIPVMEAIGADEDLAALSLGANGRQIFWRITLPNVKWGLLYGIILCNARAMGEFGAVYVVGGRVSGQTNTMPLEVETLFQGFNSPAAFALASVLSLLAGVTLVLKSWVEAKVMPVEPPSAVAESLEG
jgi:sulfate transport system permease protein